MENYLKIENLNVLNVIKDFDIVINDKGIYSIVGKSSSGKTLLTKTFAGFIEYEGRSEERRVGKECRSRWSPYH